MEIADDIFKIRRKPEGVRMARGRNVMVFLPSRKNWPGLAINSLILNNKFWILLSS